MSSSNAEDEEEEEIRSGPAFFKDLDQSVEHFIMDCLQFDDNNGRDPRVCHSFYQLINDRLCVAVNRGFLEGGEDFLQYWEKYDSWAASAVEEFKVGSGRKFSAKSPKIPATAEVKHQLCKGNIYKCIKEVFMESRNEQGQYNLADLNSRLLFFSKLSHYNADIMDHYWHRLLCSTVDQLILYLTLAKGSNNSDQKSVSSSASLSPSVQPPMIGRTLESINNIPNSPILMKADLEIITEAKYNEQLNSVVLQYKKVHGSEWQQKLKSERPEIYKRFLERQRTLLQSRKSSYTQDEKMHHLTKLRQQFKNSLRSKGWSTEEIEKKVAEKEKQIIDKYKTMS